MKTKDIQEFAEFVEMAKELAPAVSEIVGTLVDMYGPVLSKVLDAVWEKQVDIKILAWQKYTKAGLTSDQAIKLILGSENPLRNMLESLAKNFTYSSKG